MSKQAKDKDVYAPKFATLLQNHLDALEWDKADFNTALERISKDAVSAAQFSRWIKGQRSVSRAMAIRAAVTLALEYENQRATHPHFSSLGVDNLDTLIQNFLNEAGYPGNLRILPPSDSIWEDVHLSKRALVIGYTPCPPWAKEEIESASGVSIEVARRVMILLGFKYRFEKISWNEMPLAIRDRRVDLIAPLLMKVPSRLYSFRFSNGIAEESSRSIGFIAAKSFCRNASSIEDVPIKYSLGYIEEEVGEVARAMLKYKEDKSLDGIESGAAWVLEGESAKECRVLAYEAASCKKMAAESKWSGKLIALTSPKSWNDLGFPICFGAHPDEPQLIEAINVCLVLLKAWIQNELKDNGLVND